MKYRYYGKISYTMDEQHPDIKYDKDWFKCKEYTFEDTYFFPDSYEMEEIKSHIKHDLMLVAGGGYNTDHIHDVRFEIKQL